MKSFRIYLLLSLCVQATPRIQYTINECWSFEKGKYSNAFSSEFDDKSWSIVNIPHTWNAEDAIDDVPGYYRGEAWYRKKISVPSQMVGKQAYIYFEGANQETEVYINGKYVGHHTGGYTRFCFDITPFLQYGKENQFAIKVDNRNNNDIPPLAADFTFWGGIYRDLYLIFSDKIHFATTDFASSGIYTDADVSEKQASIKVRSLVTNNDHASSVFKIETTLINPDGKEIARKLSTQSLPANSTSTFNIPSININDPVLWSTETPNLYTVYSRIYADGHIIDEVSTTIGLRWYSFSPDDGFHLNGKPCKLIGTNRHQDYLRKGNALGDEMHVRDILLLKEMGANFLRVSHYPQDPVVMEMCDKLGILTSVEIPIISTISESKAFYDNSIQMVKEMICQDYNRPSVIIWGYMNEVLLHPLYQDDDAKQQGYFSTVRNLAWDIEDTIRKEDSKRYTMMACNGNFEAYHKVGLDKIPMILGWNLYQGWYSGAFSDFDKFIDKVHQSCPDKSLIITEYGADVDTRLHSFTPRRFDFTVEYGNLFNEYYLKSILQKSFIAGAAIWTLHDFYSEGRKDAVPHVNSKGITGLDRQLKDTYLLYQATLQQNPIVKIGSGDWKTRGGLEDPVSHTCIQPINIYTNLSEIDIYLNGKIVDRKAAVNKVVKINMPFKAGTNVIEAVGVRNNTTIRDILEIDFKMIPSDLTKFTEINILLGSHRYFEDREAAIIWIPEKEYEPGSWGYIGGAPYERKSSRGMLNNSDKDILNTDQDPIYQSQRVGIDSFKIDVPNVFYSIYCYLAVLESKGQETIIYNPGNNAINTNIGENIFDISINDLTMLYGFNPKQETKDKYGIIKKFSINVSDGKGIRIKFIPQKGKTILNALRIYRNY
jgi:beta-galactosidase